MSKTITLKKLRDMEQSEYRTLVDLRALRYDYTADGETEKAEELYATIQWQQGRWGMLSDLIEELEKE